MLPRFIEAQQSLPAPVEPDVTGAARSAARSLAARLRPGASVAVTAGSRGIAQIDAITGHIVAELGGMGLAPFIVPAMGSHGGGTAEGQREVLAGYGITESSMGAPIRASMDVEVLGKTAAGVPAHFDRIAAGADAVIALNRVKPHTILRGALGSGLVKMVSIGLGKHVGAQTLHARGLQEHVVPVAESLISNSPLVGGIAVVENARGDVAHIEAMVAEAIPARDQELLQTARSYMPHIPIEPLDVLVIRRMGKSISGTGFDPNVTGIHRRLGGEPDHRIETIVVLDLTEDSHGNATGVGMADLITHRLRDAIDWEATSINCLTSGWVAGLKLPFALPSDREAIETAVRLYDPATVRMAIIDDTLHLTRIWLSENLIDEARAHSNLTLAERSKPLTFDATGMLGVL